MPYRLETSSGAADALNRLIDLGALDVEMSGTRITALMPDSVTPAQVSTTLSSADVVTSEARARDAGSVWVLSPRPVHVAGRVLHLIDAEAFGTGQHPTTALCLEALQAALADRPDRVLDVGTGSGVLALAALLLGVPRATGVDIEPEALRVAAENARLNGVHERLQLTPGGPEALTGTWPLVLANVLAAPLIEMAPALVRRVGHHGHLVLSGIPSAAHEEVGRAYRQLGMRPLRTGSSGTWTAQVLSASW